MAEWVFSHQLSPISQQNSTTMPPQHPLHPWQHVASTVLFDHPRCRVIEDTVLLPSGQQTDWIRVQDGRDYVKLICIDDAGRVLVASQYNHPTRRIVHEFPGGQVKDGEAFADAARRELQEEMGLYPHHLVELGTFLANNRRSDVRCAVFLARNFEARPTALDDEELFAFEWLPIATIEQHIRDNAFDNGVLLAAWALFRVAH